MKLTSLLKERKLSVYQCAKESTVPYTTLLDIVKGKTKIEKCTAETLYKLAKTLNVAMEELLAECFRKNDLPLCNDYADIRNCALSEPLYPRDVILAAKLDASLDVKEQCLKEAIPEFLRFNIIEGEIRNVC